MADFRANCEAQAGCAACSLWHAVRTCGSNPSERCTPQGDYVLILSKGSPPENRSLSCFSVNHWMVLPARPCTGVEDPVPACTGQEGERYWWVGGRVPRVDGRVGDVWSRTACLGLVSEGAGEPTR